MAQSVRTEENTATVEENVMRNFSWLSHLSTPKMTNFTHRLQEKCVILLLIIFCKPVMVSTGAPKMGCIELFFINPDAKINDEYYGKFYYHSNYYQPFVQDKMLVLLVTVFYHLTLLYPSCCYWNRGHYSNQLSSHHHDALISIYQRSKRDLSLNQNMNQYVYYIDVVLEGPNIAAVSKYLSTTQLPPANITIDGTLAILTFTHIQATTECNIINGDKTCKCVEGFVWNLSTCFYYPSCSKASDCSCVIVKDDNIPSCQNSFSSSAKPVVIQGSFTLNLSFTKDLTYKTSALYMQMTSSITKSLVAAYIGNTQLQNVSVLHFRSTGYESVTADYMIILDEPTSVDTFLNNNNAAYEMIQGVTSSQLSIEGIASIQPLYITVKYLFKIELMCRVNESMTTVDWHLEANNITNALANGGNVRITSQFSADSTVSTLIIDKASERWKGIYNCHLSRGPLVLKAKAMVDIVLLPVKITKIPMQQSLTSKDSLPISLQCCIQNDGEAYVVSWRYNNEIKPAVLVPRSDLKCYQLVVPYPERDSIYTCMFTNSCGQTKTESISVTVIEDKFCNSEINNGIGWNITKAGISAIMPCPPGKSGHMTRNCSLSGVWLNVQDNCVSQVLLSALDSVKDLEQGLGNLQEKVPQIMEQLVSNEGTTITNGAEMQAMVNILGAISKASVNSNNTFDTGVVTNFLRIVSNITDSSLSEFWQGDQSRKASQVLQSTERFSQLLQPANETFKIVLPNIQLKGSIYDKNNVEDYKKAFDESLGVSMFINHKTISSLANKTNVTIISMTYATLGSILSANSEKFKASELISIIQSTSIRLDGFEENTDDFKILMTFGMNNSNKLYIQRCVFWDYKQPGYGGGWSDVGCQTIVYQNFTNCTCKHLTSFAVLMSISMPSILFIDEITCVGIGASIVSLLICVTIEWIVWKHVVRTNVSYFRHTSLVNIAFSLLFADICFLASVFPSIQNQNYACLGITFLNHFFYLSLFFWTFCQSMMLLHQLVFLFHYLRKRVYIALSFLIGYMLPATISMITFLYFHPRGQYIHQAACWLNPESGAIFTFIIPAGSIICINFLTLLVVISKLLRPSVSDASPADDRETARSIMKAILVLTPVFGLTWAFGFALLKDLGDLGKKIFTYGFAGMNAFQGFFILLTTCFMEKKVRDAFLNQLWSTPSSASSATTTSTADSQSKTSYNQSLKK
ncbi:adhesion G-protein coupled receptor F3 [Microcaecilia unicolor]|uniref:Adhesion G-protein coupled receptor F3 n=1 Tax=Microcaecilia unicolor TaxID=1415580 RepID=A0A6P7XK42_9AMPH|nr:adhesion G-protein coupled receptor F3 [Microcaecilia unicolor]